MNLGFKLKTEKLEVDEMFWQVFSLVQTHVRVDISLNNTVAIPDQFENTD